jgi:hypothetical protein
LNLVTAKALDHIFYATTLISIKCKVAFVHKDYIMKAYRRIEVKPHAF